MDDPTSFSGRYPLLEALLMAKRLNLRGTYTTHHIAEMFDVKVRTVQDWISDGKLQARDLPGRGRCLSVDLEAFLESSIRRGKNSEDNRKE